MNEDQKRFEELIDQLNRDSLNNSDSDFADECLFEMQLQDKIEASLKRSFSSTAPSLASHRQRIEEILLVTKAEDPAGTLQTHWFLGLAASILLLIGLAVWQFSSNRPFSGVTFQQTALAKLYREAVDRGFKPYYVCDDPVRFANEFNKRQGVPLELKDMPEGHAMVGISYLGGISRKATTMLGLVVGEPVLVFVDRLSNDNDFVRRQVGVHDGILISRKVVDELVFYEVSKLKEPMLIDYFTHTE